MLETKQDQAPEKQQTKGFLSRLYGGLAKSAQSISNGLTSIFTKRKLDDEAIGEIENLLLDADFGPATTEELIEDLKKGRYDRGISVEEVKEHLSGVLARILKPCEQPVEAMAPVDRKPFVVMVVGINGSGKTTVAAKLAHKFQSQGKTVGLVAADTFRAAAVEQLQIWGQKLKVPVFTTKSGGDSAALAYTSIEQAREQGLDTLIIDTAGRLHNKEHLMNELSKVTRVIKKCDETAPHATLLVLDASIGQNTLRQVDVFKKMSGINGLIMTKLDGTAKGGTLVTVAEKMPLPIVMLSFGESLDAMGLFKAEEFSKNLLSL